MSKSVKIIGIIAFILAFFMLTIGGVFSMYIFWAGFVIIIGEAIGVFVWQVNRLDWKCIQCGTVFSINLKQNVTGMNGGSVKELHCPHCQKKTWCEPVVKQSGKNKNTDTQGKVS